MVSNAPILARLTPCWLRKCSRGARALREPFTGEWARMAQKRRGTSGHIESRVRNHAGCGSPPVMGGETNLQRLLFAVGFVNPARSLVDCQYRRPHWWNHSRVSTVQLWSARPGTLMCKNNSPPTLHHITRLLFSAWEHRFNSCGRYVILSYHDCAKLGRQALQ